MLEKIKLTNIRQDKKRENYKTDKANRKQITNDGPTHKHFSNFINYKWTKHFN